MKSIALRINRTRGNQRYVIESFFLGNDHYHYYSNNTPFLQKIYLGKAMARDIIRCCLKRNREIRAGKTFEYKSYTLTTPDGVTTRIIYNVTIWVGPIHRFRTIIFYTRLFFPNIKSDRTMCTRIFNVLFRG